MGEMADFAIDDTVEFENVRDLYHNGHLSSQEAFEYGFEDSTGCHTGLHGNNRDYTELNSYESLKSSIEQDIDNFGSPSNAELSLVNREPVSISYYDMGESEELKYFYGFLVEKYSVKYTKKMLDQIKRSGFNQRVVSTKEDLYEYCTEIKNKYPKAYEAVSYILYKKYGSTLSGYGCVNKEAVKRSSKENPTCNMCNTEMKSRIGQFGKFYFCSNKCDGQKTVSDSYWQEFKSKSASLR